MSADRKAIRPFNRSSAIFNTDTTFRQWCTKPWQKLVLEVGCGVGLHPIRWAQHNKGSGIIAIERTQNKFQKFKGRLENHKGLENLYAVGEEAELWLPNNLEKTSLNQIFLLYPNPYPKEKQANKRWHRNPFFEFLIECLKPCGTITMATNERFYLNEFKDYCLNHWKLTLVAETKLNTLNDFKPRTHFEKKYLLNNEDCSELVFTKKA